MKKIAAVLLSFLVLAALAVSGGCSGADNVVGPPAEVTAPPRDVTPHPRPTPNPCRQNPADCD